VESWVLEHPFKGMIMNALGPHVYVADRETMETVLEIDRKMFPNARIREATEEDWTQIRERNLGYTDLKPECRDWTVTTSFDGQSWPLVYRDKSLDEILEIAKRKADGHSGVYFRPAREEEVKGFDDEVAEDQRRLLQQQKRYSWIGTVAQVVITIGLAYWGAMLASAHPVLGPTLLVLAALSAVNLLWVLLKFSIYQISFVIGRGFRDGKGE